MISEDTVERACLELFAELGYATANGPTTGPGEPGAERGSFTEVVLLERLRSAIARLNTELPESAREDAVRKVLTVATQSLERTNRTFHKMLRDGVPVEYNRPDGSIAGDLARLVDFSDPDKNDWLAINQFTVVEGHHNRRPDIVVFLNGLPVGLIELKNPSSEDSTIWSAYSQLQTYKAEIPSLLSYNEVLVVSDGLQARIGSLTANQEWFKVWRTVDGTIESPRSILELDVLIRGVFDQQRFLDMLHSFVVFEEDTDSDRLYKVIAGYHQFHAVKVATAETVRASGMVAASGDSGSNWGDRRVGVVWHTQGSGKSFSMLFFAASIIREASMQNPTVVVITDRNDLDDQLFGQFQRCHELLGQTPVQAQDREELRGLLRVASGGVVFTTIHKFLPDKGEKMPELSDRRNIVVIVDEAHRSQYDMTDGFARHMRDALPKASFIGFTGTPIETNDANTRAVFGDYISVYDIRQAVIDQATVPIYYESRIAKLRLNEAELPTIDDEFEEITEGEEEDSKRKLQTKWAALEALVGDPKRIALVAADLVEHYEKRLEALNGKAMVVCMSRRICVDLYNAIVKLRPEWASAADDDYEQEKTKGCVAKIVMTGSAADGPEWQPHIRNKLRRSTLARRLKDPKDPFRIVIVRDMWLTGFDAPCLHTMYVDKPMRGHGLMQAIARVNRVFKDKPGGLVVDYLGLADQLKKAIATYTESGGQGNPTYDTAQAIAVMLEKHEVASRLLYGFDWSAWTSGTGSQRLALLPAAQEHILEQKDGKRRFVQAVGDLSRAFSLCAASDDATEIRDDIAFFQAVQAALSKRTVDGARSPEEIDAAVRQLVAKAIVASDEIIDVFTAAGLKRPDISILDDRFLAEIRGLKHKNVAAELLERLLKDEIQDRSKKNAAQGQLFSEKLKSTLNAYHNRAIATQEIIEELIRLAKDLGTANKRGEDLGLSDEELAFYDALATNDSAKTAMGDEKLKVIAGELIQQVRKSVTIDWQFREGARAKIRVLVKRILKRHGYPPDLQDEAVKVVLKQTELLCAEWI
jgi:type I restriction enzyme R subunit